MMTLTDASDLVTPILKSDLLQSSATLQAKVASIKVMFQGFKLTNPFQLSQFEILDHEKECAFRELIAMYEAELASAAESV